MHWVVQPPPRLRSSIAATTPSGGGGEGGWTLKGVTILRSIVERGCDSRLYSSEKKKNTSMTKDNMGVGSYLVYCSMWRWQCRGMDLVVVQQQPMTATSTQTTTSLSGGFGRGRNAQGTCCNRRRIQPIPRDPDSIPTYQGYVHVSVY